MAPILPVTAVYFHAWKHEDGNQTYCEAHENPDGWCVYNHHENAAGTLIDMSAEQDFADRDAAVTEAEARAAALGVECREY